MKHIVYLHGFRSSPASSKARLLGQAVQGYPDVHYYAPALSEAPARAVSQIVDLCRPWPPAAVTLVGSSLGGFYATWLAEQLACRAVLLNPAVNPARDLAPYIGPLSYFHDPTYTFDFKAEYLDELCALQVERLTPERYFLIAAMGDELLDWREMTARYAGAARIIWPGSDHGLSNFTQILPSVLGFAGLMPRRG